MTDDELVQVARRIDCHNAIIQSLLASIYEGGHPRAKAIYRELREEGLGLITQATYIIHSHMIDPSQWEVDSCGIRRKTTEA